MYMHVCLIVCSFSDFIVLKVGGRFRKMAETHAMALSKHVAGKSGAQIHVLQLKKTMRISVNQNWREGISAITSTMVGSRHCHSP